MSLSLLDLAVASIGLSLSVLLYYTAIRIPKGLYFPLLHESLPIVFNLVRQAFACHRVLQDTLYGAIWETIRPELWSIHCTRNGQKNMVLKLLLLSIPWIPLSTIIQGDLVYLNVLGQSVLVVNSADMERQLFNKRGAIYSGRPETTMMHDL